MQEEEGTLSHAAARGGAAGAEAAANYAGKRCMMAGAEADAGLLLELKRSRWLLAKRCTVSVEDDGCCKC
ncbi:hypothetical protein D5086_000862 [Populus alba]|uniref:Uncharacterized protein n=1 Tax=Populus alba TaxID=43335 RepID=A0ACC4CX18_POPAL